MNGVRKPMLMVVIAVIVAGGGIPVFGERPEDAGKEILKRLGAVRIERDTQPIAAKALVERPGITFDDVIDLIEAGHGNMLRSPVWLPNGEGLLVPVADPETQQLVIQELFVPGGEIRALVPGFNPRPAPDGTRFAYIGPDLQLWVAAMDGSDAQGVSAVPGGIAPYGDLLPIPIAWSPDSSSIAYGMVNWLHASGIPFGEIWLVDLETGESTLAYESFFGVFASLSWHPDGSRLVFASGDLFSSAASIAVLTIETGEVLHLAEGVTPETFLLNPVLSPDGSLIAFKHDPLHKAILSSADVAVVPTEGGEIRLLTDQAPFFNLGLWEAQWAPDGSGVYTHCRRHYYDNELCFVNLDGDLQRIHYRYGQDIHGQFAISPDGRYVAFQSDGSHGQEQIRVGATSGFWSDRTLLDVTLSEVAEFKLGYVYEIAWPSADGLSVPGLLILPEPQWGRFNNPLVVDLHGGPQTNNLVSTGSLFLETPLEWHAWTSQGYAVLVPDYRSSQFPGFGEWSAGVATQDVESRDFDDIMSMVDFLADSGFVDENKMVLYGHSHGGFMAQWLLTHTDRFQGIVIKEGGGGDPAALYNFALANGLFGFTDYYDWYYGGSPSEVPDNYFDRSAINFVDNVSTPSLVLAGEYSDGSLGRGTGISFADALAAAGADVRYIEYPGEAHVFEIPENLRSMCQTVSDFFAEKVAGDD